MRSAPPLLLLLTTALLLAGPAAAQAPDARGGVLYLHDDGDGNTNQGPPSSFDPDMLWGNYFLTEPGGEVITTISVAFGPTFPSLEDGPVTFWLLDDPDADLDPRNATALTSVTATPDVFNDTFFTVEIPPTLVSGAFFVGASAKLQGGEDRPARVDTDHPGDLSWFFYAPEIADVIDDLASAPFGTRMDDPEFVIFPGAFMIRATGEPAPASGALTFEPDTLAVTLAPGEATTASVTLTNPSDAAVAFTFSGFPGFVTDVAPAEGTIPAGGSVPVAVTFDATGLAAGFYEASLGVETDEAGGWTYAYPVLLTVSPGTASEDDALPGAFALDQNHPNPFSATTTIRYALPEPEHVTLRVYDALGRVVATLVDAPRPAGHHEAVWEGAAAGVYFYRIEAGAFARTLRMTRVR